MGRLGIDPKFDVIAGGGEPTGHREVVFQQHVFAPDDQQRRGKAVEIAVDGRDIRSSAIFHVADIGLEEIFVGDPASGRRPPAQVVGAELKCGAGELVDGSGASR
jgi:hypothetical protein